MSSGKSKTQTTTQTSAPPQYVADQLKFGTEEARRLYDQGAPAFFSGQTYAGFTPQQEQALQMTEQRALAGSPLQREASNQLQRTLSGEFLGANQYIDPMIEAGNRSITRQFGETIMPSIQSSLGRSGRYGNNAATQQLYTNAQRTLAQQLADTEANVRGNAYAGERQLMNAAIGQAPAFAQQDYADLGKLAMVGEQRQGMDQNAINEAMQRYQYANTIDQQQLDQFLSRVTGISPQAGTIGTVVSPKQGSNTFGQLLGLAGTAAGMYFGGPAGAAAGGSLGGALGGGNALSPVPMATQAGGTYGGGYTPYSGGQINWYPRVA